MIRRVFQIEITTSDEDDSLKADECHVRIRNPRTGQSVFHVAYVEAERWLAE